MSGDGGVAWLRKAVQRCEEQAAERGVSVEEVAAERYGVRINRITTGSFRYVHCSLNMIMINCPF